MIKVRLPISIVVKGPFISQSTEPGSYGLDAVQARDADGRPIIPGTHVTGKLRQAWQELNDAIGNTENPNLPNAREINELLGQESSDDDWAPKSKELYFSDFVLARPGSSAFKKVRYRIAVDKDRGAVKEQALAMIECIIDSGELAEFRGEVTFLANSKDEAEKIKQRILTGLRWVDQTGAFGSIGFGKVEEVSCREPEMTEIRPGDEPLEEGIEDEVLELAIKPLSPFCIAKKHMTDNNLFESLEYIPGNVILGTLKRTLDKIRRNGTGDEFEELDEHFSKIRVLHAFAGSHCHKRPVAPPLSLIKADGELYDAALLDGPCLINGKAPEFSIDWNDDSDVREKFGWASLRRELRVRTAIDPVILRSEKEKLFSYEMIVPDCHLWLTRAYFGSVPDGDRQKVIRQFKALARAGLIGFGKAKTLADITILPEGTITEPGEAQSIPLCYCTNREVVITLQSPALLLSPEIDDDLILDENAGHKELFEAYRRVWDELSGGELKLKRFFARQYLSGGNYQFIRFMKGNMPFYYPWILTEAGSVFVFNIKEGCQPEVLDEWLKGGLPLPKNVIKFYGISALEDRQGETHNQTTESTECTEKTFVTEQWKHCPFIPQNGFGEVAVNLEIHWDAMPQHGLEKISDPCED